MRTPLLAGLAHRGGAASNGEMRSDVASAFHLSPEQLARPHDPRRGGRSEVDYRLAWLRSKLRSEGLIEPDGREHWRLTSSGQELGSKLGA
jgi:restriction system protein